MSRHEVSTWGLLRHEIVSVSNPPHRHLERVLAVFTWTVLVLQRRRKLAVLQLLVEVSPTVAVQFEQHSST